MNKIRASSLKGVEGRSFKGKSYKNTLSTHWQGKSCSVLPSLGSQGDLKIVLECLHKQVTEAKKAASHNHNKADGHGCTFWVRGH